MERGKSNERVTTDKKTGNAYRTFPWMSIQNLAQSMLN